MKARFISVEEYDSFFELSEKNGGLFSSKAWASIYDAALRLIVIENPDGQWVAGCMAYEAGKSFAKTLITPPYAPNIGFFIVGDAKKSATELSKRKKIAAAFATFLEESKYAYYKLDFPRDWVDMQPFHWAKMRVNVRYTYCLDLSKNSTEWLAQADSKLRNLVNKGSKEEWTVSSTSVEETFKRLSQYLSAKGLVVHTSILEKLVKQANDRSSIISLTNGNQTGYIGVCWWDRDEMVYLFGEIDRSLNNNALAATGLSKCIDHAIAKGCHTFDFEGSMIPEVEKFFRGFGGDLVAYFSLSGGKWFWPALYRWRYKNQ